jgi:transposase
MPARYVKPYVQRGKSDALDAAAICEGGSPDDAVCDNQDARTAGRADAPPRARASRETADHVGESDPRLPREFGIVAPLGIGRVSELIAVIKDDADPRILPEARIAMRAAADQLCDLQKRIKQIEQAIRAWHRGNEASRRLATIPGVGSITASAIVATVANATEFKSARHFAAFLGLTPKQCSTGGRQRLGCISKQGDAYIRRLLVLGGTSLVRYARGAGGSIWAKQLLARRPTRL